MIEISDTTTEQASDLAGQLDFASRETERITGTDPLDSLRGSRTVWAGETPLCSFGIDALPDGSGASAWMMVTRFVKEKNLGIELLRGFRKALREAVKKYGRVLGYAWSGGDAPRMLNALGARFAQSGVPSLILWELRDNPRLRRGS